MRTWVMIALSFVGFASWGVGCAPSTSPMNNLPTRTVSSVATNTSVSIEPNVRYEFPLEVQEEPSKPPSGTLIEVQQKSLFRAPDRYDPKERFVAIIENGQCDVWEIKSGLYMGQVPKARCSHWRESGFEKYSPNRQYQIDISSSVVKLVSRAAPNQPRVLNDLCGAACGPIIASRWNPNSTKIALARKEDARILVFDVQSATMEIALALQQDERVIEDQIGWGTEGLVVATYRSNSIYKLNLYRWPSLQENPIVKEVVRRDLVPGTPFETIPLRLEPFGRFYMHTNKLISSNDTNIMLSEVTMTNRFVLKFDLKRSAVTENKQKENTVDPTGTWLAHKWPVWEVLKTDRSNVEAWWFFTSPQCRMQGDTKTHGKYDASVFARVSDANCTRIVDSSGCKVIDVPKEKCIPRKVNPIDPSGRWKGINERSIQRLSDNEILNYVYLSYRTEAGVYDGTYVIALNRYYWRLGDDPLSSPIVLQNEHLAYLFYHPNLVEDFFAGRSVAPPHAIKERVGMPPSIELLGHEVKGDKLTLRVKAHDGGDGVSMIRRWVDTTMPYREPVPIASEQEAAVVFEFKKRRWPCHKGSIYNCDNAPVWADESVSVQACNNSGLMCSPMISCTWNRENDKVTCHA